MVVTKRVIVPRTPAGGGNNRGKQRARVCQDEVVRAEGQRIRPSSRASLEAAASSTTSVDSQPPLGTKRTKLSQPRRGVMDESVLGKLLTDPKIWTFSTGNDEDFAGCPGNRNGAAHDPWC
jgi:hypothetical protein